MKSLARREFGNRLKQARTESGINKSRLSELVGVKPSAITRWESGAIFPSDAHFARLCNVLNKPQQYFLGEPSPLPQTVEELTKVIEGQERRLRHIPADVREILTSFGPEDWKDVRDFLILLRDRKRDRGLSKIQDEDDSSSA